ncbi:MAG: NADH:flavin oxidoreductase/NADH oxidase [Hyphomicrobiaceae bacterium]
MARPLLFTPLKLRDLTLRNRAVVSPMCQYRAVEGHVEDWHYAHHARFALGGVGTSFLEATAVTPEGRITHGCTGIWSDSQIPGLRRIADLYRQHGVVPAIQIGHAGRKASCERPFDGGAPIGRAAGPEARWQTVAPSAIAQQDGHPVPHALSAAEIETMIDAFTAATRRALAAGFEIVEVHGAHGYLIHSFFSPLSNARTDAFGGSAEKRMRFPLMVAEAVRAAWPADRPVFYRASVTDGIEGGVTPEDTVALARELKRIGIDVIDCSAGGLKGPVTMASTRLKPGFQVPLSEAVKRGADIATMAVGAILTGPQAEAILSAGRTDLVALGREMLSDPSWCYRAALALGIERPYDVLPQAFGFFLERRAAVLDA